MGDSVEKIESLKTEDENRTGINGSDEGVKVHDDDYDVSLVDKPKDDLIAGSSNSPSSVPSKGKGLRKWRRIKRDVYKDGSGSVDSSKAGKRGLSNSAPNPGRGQKGESSLSSTGAIVRNLGNEMNGSILDPKLVIGNANSEISEDQSSMSSTAASGSVLRNGPAMVAAMSEKKGVNGVKARAKSKKARGGSENFEKENSITSSLESDSRSSNFVFLQGTDYVASNDTGNHVGENSDDEGQDGEKHVLNEVDDVISKENGGDKDLADDENQGSVIEYDPLAESISQLQSAQEAFEKEIQKLRELGDESQQAPEGDDHEASSSQLFNLRGSAEITSHYLKAHANTLKQNVGGLESKIEEANGILKSEEVKRTTLEEYEKIEAEMDDLYIRKFDMEFQYLLFSEALQKRKLNLVDQVAISNELRSSLNVARDAENDANILNRQAEKLETRVEEAVETEEVSDLQKRVSKVTSCLIMQFTLLLLVFISFVFYLFPDNAGVVPT